MRPHRLSWLDEPLLAVLLGRARVPCPKTLREGLGSLPANAVRGKFYRPVKAQVTARLDADVLAWLKAGGQGYQTRMNAILRRAMLADLKAGE